MKVKKLSIWLTLILIFTLLSCIQQQAEQVDLAQVREANNEFDTALKNADLEKVAATYADDAISLPPNHEAIEGKEAILDSFWTMPQLKNFEFVHEEKVEFSGSGNLAYAISKHYKVKYQPEGGVVQIGGPWKHIRIWRKQTDGSWKIQLEMWSLNEPFTEETS